MKCRTCKWWFVRENDNDVGFAQCRRYPPSTPIPGMPYNLCSFPYVHEDWFCGEHTAKTNDFLLPTTTAGWTKTGLSVRCINLLESSGFKTSSEITRESLERLKGCSTIATREIMKWISDATTE